MELDLERMSRHEKLMAMHALWEDLSKEEVSITSPTWHEVALQKAEVGLKSGHEKVHDWEVAKAELRRRAS
jgi:Putative addiction module component